MTEESPDDVLFLSVDASTTSVRAAVFDSSGAVLAEGRAPLEVTQVEADGYEQDAATWWPRTAECIAAATQKLAPDERERIATLSITHQRETVVVTDATGKPCAPARLWLDGRAEEEAALVERKIGGVRLHNLTGQPASASTPAFKILHQLREDPALAEVAHVHDLHSLLMLALTGRAVSCLASADATGLLDLRRRAWSGELVKVVGLDRARLPELVEPGYVVGRLSSEAAAATSLPHSVTVYAGAGDAQAACLGAGIIEPGRAFLDLGSSINLGVLTHGYVADRAGRTLIAALPGRYCLEVALRGATLGFDWLARTTEPDLDLKVARQRLEAAAAEVPPGAGGLLALPYWSGVKSPFWNDGVRGALIGLSPSHGPAHLYRAFLEGLALEARLGLDGIEAATHTPIREVVLLGGASTSLLWRRVFTDVLARPVRPLTVRDGSLLGVAVGSAVAHGLFDTFEQATSAMVHTDERLEPGPASRVYERLYREVYRGLYASLVTRLDTLAELRNSSASNG